MKSALVKCIMVVIVFGFACNRSTENNNVNNSDSLNLTNSNTESYDSILAKKYGADQYGMKKYIFAYLKSGPNRSQDSAEAVAIQKGHMTNIQRLANEGKLILAGPFLDDTEIRGIFIFDVESIDEARDLINTDPAVKSGRLIMELHPWYGSAGLMELNKIHKKISRDKF
ncbi:MAG: YciI family protein [Bacteroidales bacterium]